MWDEKFKCSLSVMLCMLMFTNPPKHTFSLILTVSAQGMVLSAEYIKKKLEQEMVLSQAFGRDLVSLLYRCKRTWGSSSLVAPRAM